ALQGGHPAHPPRPRAAPAGPAPGRAVAGRRGRHGGPRAHGPGRVVSGPAAAWGAPALVAAEAGRVQRGLAEVLAAELAGWPAPRADAGRSAVTGGGE